MVPSKLWKEEVLYQSDYLIDVYKNKLVDLGMLEYAEKFNENDSKGAIGGQDEDETNKHFSERFLTSSARVQFLVLDPKQKLIQISNDLKSTFNSGHISLLDIPSGTGAGIISLLCNLYELRKFSKTPSLPLYINILAGDYSTTALDIYKKLLDDIRLELQKELIFIEYSTFEWDASSMLSTNKLTTLWLKEEEKFEEFYILMSAFSGVGSSNYKRFEESFKFIQNRICHQPSTIIFIEPNTTNAKSFGEKISKTFSKLFTWLSGKEESTDGDRFNWYDAVRKNTAKSDVLVKQYSRI